MAIPESFIDELISKADIVDVVSRYLELKKSGSSYFGLCPFHNEKTPSFSVSADKQIFHCFGCGEGGGAISFIMKYEGLEFLDAVRFLAAQYNMTVPDDTQSPSNRARRETLLALNRAAAKYFHDTLKAAGGEKAADYLANRKVSKRTVTNFGLGFAPDEWDGLIRSMTAGGFSKADLTDAGLAVKNKSGGIYDRFRNRVIFPIIDIRGSVVGFGGRVLDDSLPKYLNSSDTPVFNKSRNLFALNIAKKSKSQRLLLVEGYMDVISLHQAGFDFAVASLGTSLTEHQARLIARYAKEVIISYDADEAGQRAASRAIEILNKTGLSVRVLRIPGAKDPDEFIKKNGAEAFRGLLDRSENHIEYKLLGIASKYNLALDDDRIAFIKEAAAALCRLENSVEAEIYTAKAAEAANISVSAVANEVKRQSSIIKKSAKKKDARKSLLPEAAAQMKSRTLQYEDIRSAAAEEGIISLLFSDVMPIQEINAQISAEEFTSEFLGKVFRFAVKRIAQNNAVMVDSFAEILTAEEMSRLASIASKPLHKNPQAALADYIKIIRFQKSKRDARHSDESLRDVAAKKNNGEKGVAPKNYE